MYCITFSTFFCCCIFCLVFPTIKAALHKNKCKEQQHTEQSQCCGVCQNREFCFFIFGSVCVGITSFVYSYVISTTYGIDNRRHYMKFVYIILNVHFFCVLLLSLQYPKNIIEQIDGYGLFEVIQNAG
jgi:hypothetical protein